mmetsp:Transcript_148312/g.413110  ORF Transcript_148312/g.413110 Transcript_148312/m.413110 type:complete len:187 (-) Transcript_148312:88-648(-)
MARGAKGTPAAARRRRGAAPPNAPQSQDIIQGPPPVGQVIDEGMCSQKAIEREVAEMEQACMELINAIVGSRQKSKDLIAENTRMVQALLQDPEKMAQEGVADLLEEVVELHALAGPMDAPIEEQLADEVPQARDLLQAMAAAGFQAAEGAAAAGATVGGGAPGVPPAAAPGVPRSQHRRRARRGQ